MHFKSLFTIEGETHKGGWLVYIVFFILPSSPTLWVPSRPNLIGKGNFGIPTKRQVSKRQVSKRLVSKRLKRQVYETSDLQNVRFTKCQVYKTSGLQNVRLQKKHPYIYSVLLVGGNPQVLLQPCLQAKWWLCFILFRGFFAIYHHNFK